MANPVSSLLVRIGADTSSLESGGRRASKSMEDLGSKAAELGKKLAVLGAAAAAAGAALATKLVKSGLDAIDVQAKLARSLDGTVNGVRALQLAAEDAGLSADAMSANLQRMNRRLGEMATTGAGPAAGWLNRLGLSAQELLKLPLEDRTARIADEISRLSTSAEMASAAFAIFGDGGLKMVPMLQQGGEAIRQAQRDVEAYGLSISQVDATKIEMANDAMTRIGRVMEAIRNQITIAFAPLLSELAERFQLVAKENKGFADIARQTTESMIRGFAKVADAVHVLRIAITGVSMAFMSIGTAAWNALDVVRKAVTAIANGIVDATNFAIRALNQLPGVEIPALAQFSGGEVFRAIEGSADQARKMMQSVTDKFRELTSAEWPSKGVEQFLEDVRKRAQEAAEAVAGVSTGGVDDTVIQGGGDDEEKRRQAELQAQRDALQAKLDQIREFAKAEYDIEIERHVTRMEQLRAALEEELLTREEYNELKAALEEKHRQRIEQIAAKSAKTQENIEKASLAARFKMASDQMQSAFSMFSTHSRKMFELNKIAGIANAIVSTHTGVAKALELPWPENLAAAASTLATGLAQVAQIKSTTFGGGGGGAAAPSGGSFGAAAPVQQQQQQAPAQLITVEGVDPGSLFSGRVVRDLIERIQEANRDNPGSVVQFA